LELGSVIQIKGEGRAREVTYVMGSDRNGWRACFRSQDAVPTGPVGWVIRSFRPDQDTPAGGLRAALRRRLSLKTAKDVAEFAVAVLTLLTALGAAIA
jgi:hypothetical protein